MEEGVVNERANDDLRGRFHGLTAALRESTKSPLEASLIFCQEFCQALVDYAGRWKTDEDPLPLLEVYTVAILSFANAASCLSSECENVPLLLEKLTLSCAELVLLLPQHIPGALWEEFRSSMKLAHSLLQESGSAQLRPLFALAQQDGIWSNTTLSSILSNTIPQTEQGSGSHTQFIARCFHVFHMHYLTFPLSSFLFFSSRVS
uniref:Zinc finger protein 292a n=1 Tax=Hippocampus comes TaxID=109280 RepID=A0A3Q2YEI9_HIPCM